MVVSAESEHLDRERIHPARPITERRPDPGEIVTPTANSTAPVSPSVDATLSTVSSLRGQPHHPREGEVGDGSEHQQHPADDLTRGVGSVKGSDLLNRGLRQRDRAMEEAPREHEADGGERSRPS